MLHTVNFGLNVSEIKSNAFYNCYSLKVITIPQSVRKIGKDVFKGTSLQSATMYGMWTVSVNGQATRIVTTDPVQNAKYLTETYLNGMWQ